MDRSDVFTGALSGALTDQAARKGTIMAGYVACTGSGKRAAEVHKTSMDIGSKFGGQLWGKCPDCSRSVRPVRDRYAYGQWNVPRHKPRDY